MCRHKNNIMENKDKSLQKFTKPNEKLQEILDKSYLLEEDLIGLTEEELEELEFHAGTSVNKLDGIENLRQGNRYSVLFNNRVKNQLWENNHNLILGTIDQLMRELFRMPSTTEIAKETGLSRVTINKHLREFKSSSEYKKEINRFELMKNSLLARMYNFACQGDMKAAQIFLQNIGSPSHNSPPSNRREQKNYIQINNTMLSQDRISTLTEEQIKQLENILNC